MLKFQEAEKLFKNDKINELSKTADGLRYLKLRSLSRKDQMEFLINKADLDFGAASSREWLKLLYEAKLTEDLINLSIQELYRTERSKRRAKEDNLINELYKVSSFDWGGLHQNSLEKTIVDNYVKKITSFDALSNAIDNELHNSMRAYVLASWYNHWTSIIIEDIFKDHKKVTPAIGLIKKIDFFVADKPFDLKVTYLPEGYVKDYRKSKKIKPELTLMKKAARDLQIGYEKDSPESFLLPDLWKKLDDHPSQIAFDLIREITGYRDEILDFAIKNPEHLACWLYENQGVRRFDASNRLFLVLIDKANFFDSWKLKRAKPLIESEANKFLNGVGETSGFNLDFKWEGQKYKVETDIIFVVKR